jgi:hypothetical protein
MDGWMDGWVGGWVGGWIEVKAVLRIAYSNEKFEVVLKVEKCTYFLLAKKVMSLYQIKTDNLIS